MWACLAIVLLPKHMHVQAMHMCAPANAGWPPLAAAHLERDSISSALTTDDLKDGDVTRLKITNSCSSTTPLSPPARGCCSCCCCWVEARQASISAQMARTAFASSACSRLMDAWVQNKVYVGLTHVINRQNRRLISIPKPKMALVGHSQAASAPLVEKQAPRTVKQ